MPGAERRFYVSNQALGKELVLTGTEHNHLANVLRLKVGGEIIIVCGDEFDYHYKITSIAKSKTALSLIEKRANKFNPNKKLTIYLAVIKHDNLALVVEKLNEIGVYELVLFRSARCQNVPVNLDKLQRIAAQSCKQCGRSTPLKIRGVLSFDDMHKELTKWSGVVFADEKEKTAKLKDAESTVIGPEGGFTDDERDDLLRIAKPVTLGPRILRSETATIVGATIVLSEAGEL